MKCLALAMMLTALGVTAPQGAFAQAGASECAPACGQGETCTNGTCTPFMQPIGPAPTQDPVATPLPAPLPAPPVPVITAHPPLSNQPLSNQAMSNQSMANQHTPEPDTSEVARDGAFRLSLGGMFGLVGSASATLGRNEVASADLDTSYGFQVQPHFAFLNVISLGGSFSIRSMNQEFDFRVPADRDFSTFIANASVMVAVRYAFDLGRVAIEPFVSFTIGASVGDDSGLGLGIRGGAHFWFSRSTGIYASGGYQRDELTEDSVTVLGPDLRGEEVTLYEQFSLDVGISFRFGG